MGWIAIKKTDSCLQQIGVPEQPTESTRLLHGILANTTIEESTIVLKVKDTKPFQNLYHMLDFYMSAPS